MSSITNHVARDPIETLGALVRGFQYPNVRPFAL